MTVNVNQVLINQTWQAFVDRFNEVASHISTNIVTLGSTSSANPGNIYITGDFSGQQGNFSQNITSGNEIIANNHIRARNAAISANIDANNISANNFTSHNNISFVNNLISSNGTANINSGIFNNLTVANKINDLKVATLQVDNINLPSISVVNLTVSGTATITNLSSTIANLGNIAANSISMGGVALGEMAKRNKIAPADLEVSSLVQVPVGSILQFAGHGLPAGYLPGTNGQLYTKTSYPVLYDWIINHSNNVDFNSTGALSIPNPPTKFTANNTHFRLLNLSTIAPYNNTNLRPGIKAA